MFDFNVQFARGGANFTMELFNQIATGGLKDNVIFSPFSIQACLALAFAGAKGETADEIANVMKYVSNFQPEVAQTFQFVLEKYKNSPLLKIANKAYVAEGNSLKCEYLIALQDHYHAEAENVNFGNSANAAKKINDWVESKTNGKIKDLISADSLNSLTLLVLLNALHFKGNWQTKFDEKLTKQDDFWISEKENIKIHYMQQNAKFGYGFFEELGCTALEMPYKDSDLSMFVLLPNEREGLKNLAEKLKTVNLVDLGDKMSIEKVDVKFPKFKIDYSIELTETLKKLGLKRIFDGPADFSDMLDKPADLLVSTIMHKASIEVNEEGTEATAATGMAMMMRSMPMHMTFLADRPFLYMIWNKKNILFAGAFVNAPKA